MAATSLPKLPSKMENFVSHLSKHPNEPLLQVLEPFKSYENRLRELYAQESENAVLKDSYVNAVPLFDGHESAIKIRARDLSSEDEVEKSKYIMPLSSKNRKPNGVPAIVPSLKDFQYNFNLFSESALSELDWSNVIAAGSSALAPLLPIPTKYGGNKRAIRQYYHQVVAPASDVDLFLYGLTQEQALEKIKQIERSIKDSILQETTTVRTKNAITITSQYPVRHIQIVLRIYKSVSEILTGFDVDCSCVAYDGKQVYATPRAISSIMTQTNHVDLSRRSPSYETRLSKYSHRGFEVYWPQLDRKLIDPTIYERSFPRTIGLARLLVLEAFPKDSDREIFRTQRRAERGRPPKHTYYGGRGLRGNVKEEHEDEVADWVVEDDISSYHSFTIPYGQHFNSHRIEKLLYTKDLLLNADWNTKDRVVKLHRHPAFFGDAADVFEDCCGYCPVPSNNDEAAIAEEESKHFVSGKVTFITDDPGRQAIGSFTPLTESDWTDMAYIGDTTRICQAIVNCNLEAVEACLENGIDPNKRDYTGRTPLHLAVMTSTAEIVRCLLNSGAYIIPRLADGQSVLHLAAIRGDVEILNAIHVKNKENMGTAVLAEEDHLLCSDKLSSADSATEGDIGTEDVELVEHSDVESSVDSEASAGSDLSAFLKVEPVDNAMMKKTTQESEASDPNKIQPDDDILDPNMPAWDSGCTPLHLATVFGNLKALEVILKEYHADPGIPIKLFETYNNEPRDAILSLVLALTLPVAKAQDVVKALIVAGAKSSQANLDHMTAFQYFVNHSMDMLDLLMKYDRKNAKIALNYISFPGSSPWYSSPRYSTPLRTALENKDANAVRRLLDMGAEYEVDFDSWLSAYKSAREKNPKWSGSNESPEQSNMKYYRNTDQPIILAVKHEFPDAVRMLIEAGADVNTLSTAAQLILNGLDKHGYNQAHTVLDAVRQKIKELETAVLKAEEIRMPEKPAELQNLLTGFDPDSYKYWVAERWVQSQEKEYKNKLEQFNRDQLKRQKDGPHQKRLHMMREMVASFRALEESLLAGGAKTFAEMHLITQEKSGDGLAAQFETLGRQLEDVATLRTKGKKTTDFRFDFAIKNLNEASRTAYVELFEAAWVGDLDKIRHLITKSGGEIGDAPPLLVGVNDATHHRAFDIALLRGHQETAFAILGIALAQFVPKPDAKWSYAIRPDVEGDEYYSGEESDEDSDEDSDGDSVEEGATWNLHERLPPSVRKQFTVEDIGDISALVKSDISPIAILQGTLPIQSLREVAQLNTDGLNQSQVKPEATAFGFAIYKDDLELFIKLVEAAIKYQNLVNKLKSEKVDDDNTPSFAFKCDDFNLALRLGRTRFLAEMMKRTGAGIPLDALIRKSGVELIDKPRYYQGLSIRGKKNKAWAQAHRDGNWMSGTDQDRPPLLIACHMGSLESVEWLLSDAPVRCYSEFAMANKDNESVKALSQVTGGFEQSVMNWLDSRRALAIHCAVMSSCSSDMKPLIRYLIKAVPESLNAKSLEGRTPLHLAFALRLPEVARTLIEAGADIEARDISGNSLMHMLFTKFRDGAYGTQAPCDHKEMERMLTLLDPSIVKQLLLRRTRYSAGAKTPLQKWLSVHNQNQYENSLHSWCNNVHEDCCPEQTLRLLLRFSGGDDVNLLDATGNSPVHSVVTSPKPVYLKVLLEVNPDCLYRENSVGRTPVELARDLWLRKQVQNAPVVGIGKQYWKVPDHAKGIAQRQWHWFINEAPLPSGCQQVWDMCREHLENTSRHLKRKLVTLAEANEVAKRLSETQKEMEKTSLKRVRESGEDDADHKDEVMMWYSDVCRNKSGVFGGVCPPIPQGNASHF